MSAIPQLSGAKRTCLLGKISSNLRPLTLERSLARKRRVPFFIAPAHGPITAFRCRKVDGLRGKPDIKRHVGSAGPVAFDPYETSPAEFSVTQKEVDSVVGWDPRSGRPMRRRRARRHSSTAVRATALISDANHRSLPSARISRLFRRGPRAACRSTISVSLSRTGLPIIGRNGFVQILSPVKPRRRSSFQWRWLMPRSQHCRWRSGSTRP